jgi:hypothetical protein
MSDKEVVLSDDLQTQIQKLEGMDDLLQQHMRPAMTQSVSLLSDAVEPNIPTLTGTARAYFGTHVLGSGINLTGYVGWKGKPTAFWMNFVEYGARPHDLTPKSTIRNARGAAMFRYMQENGFTPTGVHVGVNGQWKTMHTHPGFAGRFLLSNAFDSNEEAVESIFSQAADDVLGDLAVNNA